MQLSDYLKNTEIDEDLIYSRKGERCTAHPYVDCSIDSVTDEIGEMAKVSGAYYFYGQIACNLTEAKEVTELKLATQKETLTDALAVKKSAIFLDYQQKLEASKGRCTDKVLEHMVNAHADVVILKTQLTQLSILKNKILSIKSAENKIRIVLKALLLKQDDLIEISRRKKEELKSIARLT